jgi:flagellar secretion chaperone FliS
MKRTSNELSYLRAAVQNASPAGLVVILFDQLINDLRGAITAIGKRDVERRCEHLKHGFLVLAQLQGSLDKEEGGEAAVNFDRFYSAVRSKMMEANFKISAEILLHQIELLLDVRQAWQEVDRPEVEQRTAPGVTEANAPVRELETANWTA